MNTLSGVDELYYDAVLGSMSDDFQEGKDMMDNDDAPSCIYSSAVRIQVEDTLSIMTDMFSQFIERRVHLMEDLGLHPTPVSYTEMSRELSLLFHKALHKSFYNDDYVA